MRLENAVDGKLWEKFNLGENRFLLKILESESLKIDFEKLNNPIFKQKKQLLNRFVELGLIHGNENPDGSTYKFMFSKRLEANVKGYIAKFSRILPQEVTRDWSRISFELFRNPRWMEKDTPLHSGTVTFKQDVLIKAGTKCLYGVWTRKNNNLWLSITPVSDIILSRNQRVDDEPEAIKTILNKFLRGQ